MRSVASVAVLYVLAILLAGTSPIGAGQGRHRDQLVDLLLPHTHFQDVPTGPGRAPRAVTADAPSGPALGAGAGADAALGLALTPPLPAFGELLLADGTSSLAAADPRPPRSHLEPPPDPPPTAAPHPLTAA